MGGFFGVVSKKDCSRHLFFGTDYHSHLGTKRGGLAVRNGSGVSRRIHDISNDQFRSKFAPDLGNLEGESGIGVISDHEDQPLMISSHLGAYAIVTVGAVKNAQRLALRAFKNGGTHFSELGGGEINPTEIVATLINEADSFENGIRNAQDMIEGSCSMLILTDHGVYAARDKFGRTPVILGQGEDCTAVTMESSAFPNLGFSESRNLGPGEVVLMTPDGVERKKEPLDRMQICSFLWVYYGYPSSSYENINAEWVRNKCGACLARGDDTKADLVAGIPDSGTAHAIGYANEAKIPYRRPFVKYTPTWPRSFMPQDQKIRDLVARMKLIPVIDLIRNQRMLFCEDSIVRGTQLKDIIERLFGYGAREVHMRPACPPLVYGCKYLNFSQSRSDLDLAARKAIKELEGDDRANLDKYSDPDTPEYAEMIEWIRKKLKLTSLKYQRLGDLVECIGLPKENLCTHCWDGAE